MVGAGYRFVDGNYMAFNIGETGAGEKRFHHFQRSSPTTCLHRIGRKCRSCFKTNKQKGNYGKMKMDDYFESQGYERISKTLVTSLDDKLSDRKSTRLNSSHVAISYA